ncbi:MAG TPA: histidinol-phosphate transaminase [Candidatus Saccharimonadales bacterium]|nr:histidinol-phosphate transaminase [Candidatus Saccharimonadales bacterium]
MIKPSRKVSSLNKYKPPLTGRQTFKGIHLDFSERTIPPGLKVKQGMADLKNIEPKLYPEYDGTLENKIADYLKVSPENVVVTNGSDIALKTIFEGYVDPGDKVLISVPTFTMFYQYAQLAEAELIELNFSGDRLAFPADEYETELSGGVKLALICNPNNPTGNLVPVGQIEDWAGKYDETVFLIDEAYGEFSGVSCVDVIKKYPNIIVTRTFSKAFGIAAARLGYAVCDKKVAEVLKLIKSPYDVSMYAYNLGIAAMDDLEEVRAYASHVMGVAKPLLEAFLRENKIEFYESGANFMLVKPDNPKKLTAYMEQNGILIRPQSQAGIEDTFRVSIGSKAQVEKFINIYEEYLKR